MCVQVDDSNFAGGNAASAERANEPFRQIIEAQLRKALLPGEVYTKKQAYAFVSNMPYIQGKEINRVLRKLKAEGFVDFDDLKKVGDVILVTGT